MGVIDRIEQFKEKEMELFIRWLKYFEFVDIKTENIPAYVKDFGVD